MRIYADEVMILNFLINWLLLKASVKLTGAPAERWRLLVSALLGAGYALLVLLPGMAFTALLPGRIVSFCLLCVCAFGVGKKAVKPSAWFFVVCCAFCGLTFTLTALLGKGIILLGGTAYYAVSFRMLVLLAGIVYLLSAVLFSRLGLHSGGELAPMRLTLGAKSVLLTALRDTGNTLTDPLSGAPVLVAQWQTAAQLLPQENLTAADFQVPVQTMQRLHEGNPALKMQLIPYRSVGTDGGLLLALRCDSIVDDGRETTGGLVAFSPTPVSDGGTYQALTGGKHAQTNLTTLAATLRAAAKRKNHVHRRQRHSAATVSTAGGAANAAQTRRGG